MLPFSPIIKNGKINIQLTYFLKSILKRLSNHGYVSYSRENRFRCHLSTTMTLEENWKLNVATDFQIFVFRNKNWSIDRIPSDKSTKRGGPRCRSAQEGKGKGVGTQVGRKEEGAFYLSMLSSLTGIIGPRWVCAAEQVVDIWLTGSWKFHCLASLTWCRLKKVWRLAMRLISGVRVPHQQ